MPSFHSLLVLAAAALTCGRASAQAFDETLYPYQEPTSSDLRSPCPGLNALANHGFLPRDGRNIDITTLVNGIYQSFSIDEVFVKVVGAVALTASTTGNNATFHLSDLTAHEVIEHDGSMTREDTYFGDAQKFSVTAYARTLINWGGADIITVSPFSFRAPPGLSLSDTYTAKYQTNN